MDKKPLLVTLADKKYLDYAKQVFASAYFNAGWQGNYMLLAHGCSEKDTGWFKKRGILVKFCQPVFPKEEEKDKNYLYFSKFYLFRKEFRKWSHIIYVDVDTIIRASLNDLLKIEGFGSVANNYCYRGFSFEMIDDYEARRRNIAQKTYRELKGKIQRNFDLKADTFCAGFFVLNTKIINSKNSIINLEKIIKEYHLISSCGDQLIFNLYFYKKWQPLSPIYDVYISRGADPWHIPTDKIKGIILHIQNEKPWDKSSPFYREWKINFEKADEINLNKILKPKKWSRSEIENYSHYLEKRELMVRIVFYLNWLRFRKTYYKIVHFVERNFPSFFKILKETKRKIILAFR